MIQVVNLLLLAGGVGGTVNNPCYGTWGDYHIQYHSPFGQSFVAIETPIRSVSLWVTDMNPHLSGHELEIAIYAGGGFDGTMLAGANRSDVGDGHDDWLDFTFANPVTVQPGQTYTVRIFDETYRWGVSVSDDRYTDGSYWLFGQPYLERDLRFIVSTDAVPSHPPCTVDLVDTGLQIGCFTGPDGEISGSECRRTDDRDGDLDIDLHDFAVFQNEFTGSH